MTCDAAIRKIHELVDLSGQADVFMLYCAADVIRKLHHARVLLGQGVGERQIAGRVRFWGGGQGALAAAASRVSPEMSARLLDLVIQGDVRAKSGLGNPVRNIEGFCAALADKVSYVSPRPSVG